MFRNGTVAESKIITLNILTIKVIGFNDSHTIGLSMKNNHELIIADNVINY